MLGDLTRKVRLFESEAHKILGLYETARSRVVDARHSLARVTALSVKQEDMLKQAVRCVEVEVFRAAHVLAFAAMIDHLHEIAARDEFNALRSARAKWSFATIDELRETQTDHAIIEAMQDAKLITKSEKKGFLGLLTRRNECAHPSDFYPDMNQSLGYISEVLSRIEVLKKRYP